MEGEIRSMPASSMTLDEPIRDTIMRDAKSIGIKLKYVLLPRVSNEERLKELRNWDLWGPLLLCIILSVSLSLKANEGQKGTTFSVVFALIWGGSAVVTVNAKLLGAQHLSFFQSVCILGYCLFPLVLGAIVCIPIDQPLVRTLIIGLCFLWACRASVVFITQLVPEARRIIAVYPVVLFYVAIAWLILFIEVK